ncbi:MAG: hypothetical protein ABUL60_34395 [Myxococcales bacterium]
MMSIERQYLICSIFLVVFLVVVILLARSGQKKVGAAQEAWRRGGWTLTEQAVDPSHGSASGVSAGAQRDLQLEHVSESPPSPAAPFHEIMGTRFPVRWRNYVRVELGLHRLCQFQIFERAALVKRSLFSLAPVGAVWFPRWRDALSTDDARLDSRFEFYAEDPVQASALIVELAPTLLAAPPFGLIEIVGSELRIYVSTIAAGLVGDYGAGLAPQVTLLRRLAVDVASIIVNSSRAG